MAGHGKYHVSPVADRTIDGIRFDSKAEASRYSELVMLEKAGVIADLERQPEFVLVPPYTTRAGEKIRGVKYRADFRYLRKSDNRMIVEDVKSAGTKTQVYKIKRTLLLWKFPDIYFEEYMV